MKQNYLFLIIILNTYHTMFSMENPAEAITKSYKLAERLDREGKLQAALDKYKEVINIKLPNPDPILGDPYKDERDLQSKATIKIADLEITLMIQSLIYANKYDEAFAQLNTLSPEKQITNKQTIQKLKKKITDNKLKWEENQLKEAEELADAGNYTLAYQTLDTLNTQKISQEINNQAIQLKASIEEKQEAARKQQLANAQQAANNGDYAEAYRILDALMDEGYLAANNLKNTIKDQQAAETERRRLNTEPARQREEQEQQEQERQRQLEEQQRQAQEETERQRLAAEQARQEQERQAEQTRQREEEARQEQLTNAQQKANRGDYAEAYRILDALRSAGYLPANDLKNRIIEQQRQAEETQREQEQQRQLEEQQRQAQEEIERQRLAAEQARQEQERQAEQTRQREEEARQETERLARERAAQPPTAQQIAQEQNLKNTLAHLTNTLKSITKYLPCVGQFPETICLPPLTRTRSKPGGRMPLPKEPRPSPVKPDQSTPLKGPAADIAKAVENAYAAIVNQRATKTYNNVVYYLKQNDLYPKNLTIDEEKELATRIRELVRAD